VITVVGARVFGFRSHVVKPQAQNSRLGTKDPCTEDCPVC
jgi:hypothetical protein